LAGDYFVSEKKIALACDHRGYDAKEKIAAFLKAKGYQVEDCGCYSTASADYPDFILKAADLVGQGKCAGAVGVCYTGIGSSIAANKVKGVRASLVKSTEEAKLTRAHNDSNMLILGSGFLDENLVLPIVETWLNTPFEGGRHADRVNKIKSYEQKHSC
jgi:ribose 5-phosphate isomerase B